MASHTIAPSQQALAKEHLLTSMAREGLEDEIEHFPTLSLPWPSHSIRRCNKELEIKPPSVEHKHMRW